VRSSKSSLSGEVVAEEANRGMREVSSAPNKDVNVRGMATTAANSGSEQGDQLHQRAVCYMYIGCIMYSDDIILLSATL